MWIIVLIPWAELRWALQFHYKCYSKIKLIFAIYLSEKLIT